MSRIAGEAQQMDSLSSQFTTAAEQVTELKGTLDNIVNNTIGTGWQGSAATKFQTGWTEQFSPSLVKLNEALMEASNEVNRRKEALLAADS